MTYKTYSVYVKLSVVVTAEDEDRARVKAREKIEQHLDTGNPTYKDYVVSTEIAVLLED